MCRATQGAQTRKWNADDKEPHFTAISLKDPAVQINIARKRHPNKRSKKNLDRLYKFLAPSLVVQKTDHHTSVIREPGKLDVTFRNSDIAKFGTRVEKKNKAG